MAKHAGGRPTKFSKAVVDEICRRIPHESLLSICRDDHLPTRETIYDWLLKARDTDPKPEHVEFSYKYDRAMDLRTDNMFDSLNEIAEDGSGDYLTKKDRNGNDYEHVNHELVQRSKIRVDTIKWQLSKMKPKKYGDKIQQEHSGNIGMTLLEQIIEDEG